MKNNILNIKGYKKIAIMGGTFDPIHYGHLVAAEVVRDELGIEKIIFIPTGHPPHKNNSGISHNEHRYLMCQLATATNDSFEVSRMEIDRPGMTYTIDTIKEIKENCDKNTEIFFITGADAINEIFTWKNPEQLLEMCSFVAVTRPGYKKDKLRKMVTEIKSKFKNKLFFLEIPALAISSTDIRQRVKTDTTIKYLLPESVEDYIKKTNLYKDNEVANGEQINTKLKAILTEARFIHTQGVARESVRLARFYGYDTEKAYIAGLLHDCAKDYSAEQKRKLCKEYKIKLDEILEAQIDLVHSFLGAEICKNEYGIKDKDILNAVRYHTTGRAKMSELEKIVYLADCIEPNRKPYEGLEKTRELAYINLDEAMKFNLETTIKYNEKKGRLIHPLSIEALEYFKKKLKEEN